MLEFLAPALPNLGEGDLSANRARDTKVGEKCYLPGMLHSPGKGAAGLKALWEPSCRSAAPGQMFKSMFILQTDSEASFSGKPKEMHLLGASKSCLPS